MFDWNDLRHFLAVARAGTTAGAARELSTSQPTVVRRIAALEQATGLALFERHSLGYRLTEDGAAILPLAERAEREVLAIGSAIHARVRQSGGAIRITAPETLANRFIMPALATFRARYPAVRVQLIATDDRLDLLRGEVDVALRAGVQDGAENLPGRRLPDAAWTMFASRDYVAMSGRPADYAAIADHPIVGGEGVLADMPAYRWLSRVAPGAVTVWSGNTLTGIRAAIQAGLGLGPLPFAVGGDDPDLVPCFGAIAELDSPMWVVSRPELRHDPCVRALIDAVSRHLLSMAPLIRGEAAAA